LSNQLSLKERRIKVVYKIPQSAKKRLKKAQRTRLKIYFQSIDIGISIGGKGNCATSFIKKTTFTRNCLRRHFISKALCKSHLRGEYQNDNITNNFLPRVL